LCIGNECRIFVIIEQYLLHLLLQRRRFFISGCNSVWYGGNGRTFFSKKIGEAAAGKELETLIPAL